MDAVVDGYRVGGYSVEVTQQFDTFARLAVIDPAHPEHPYKVELAANWRALPPVMMDVGPVLHADDVVAGKMSALYTRAEPRDFLDIDAALMTGRYTRAQLCELAEQSDAGGRIAARLAPLMTTTSCRRRSHHLLSEGRPRHRRQPKEPATLPAVIGVQGVLRFIGGQPGGGQDEFFVDCHALLRHDRPQPRIPGGQRRIARESDDMIVIEAFQRLPGSHRQTSATVQPRGP